MKPAYRPTRATASGEAGVLAGSCFLEPGIAQITSLFHHFFNREIIYCKSCDHVEPRGWKTHRGFLLTPRLLLPMNQPGEAATMIISVAVSETVIRAARSRNMSVEELVDSPIDKGMEKATGRPMVSSAIDRIRALHSEVVVPKR